jgi:hypothetical protein
MGTPEDQGRTAVQHRATPPGDAPNGVLTFCSTLTQNDTRPEQTSDVWPIGRQAPSHGKRFLLPCFLDNVVSKGQR